MAATTADIKTDRLGTDDLPQPITLRFPVAASTTIYAGSMVATNTSGNAVPASASSTLKIWGRAKSQQANTGAAGALTVEVEVGAFYFTNGTGADAISSANVGQLCYASDDQTVNLTDAAGTRPAAGVIMQMPDSGTAKVAVLTGFPSLYSAPQAAGGLQAGMVPPHAARGMATSNVADLTAFTVANDGITLAAGDRVLLPSQTTSSQNGIYVVGTVAVGAAPLTRATDFDDSLTAEFQPGVVVQVQEGTVGAGTRWLAYTAGPYTIGTTLIRFQQIEALQTGRVAGQILRVTTASSGATPGAVAYGALDVTNPSAISGVIVPANLPPAVRYVMTTNVANLASFTVAQDGVTGAAGDLVLLANQTTPSQAGVYVVGTVGGGTAPLTRVAWLTTGAIVTGGYSVYVNEGTLFASSSWFIKEAGPITIGTTSHTWYPEAVTQSLALTAGTLTITNVPVLSVTKTGWAITRRIAGAGGGAPTLTVGGYCVSTGGNNGVTAGVVGTASVIVEACVGAGTINNADTSTLEITVINR